MSDTCRCVHVVHDLRSAVSEQAVLDLVRVCRRRNRDDRVIVLDEASARGLGEIPVAAVPRSGILDFSLGQRLGAQLRSWSPKVVHAHGAIALRAAAAAIKGLTPAPRLLGMFHTDVEGGWLSRWLGRRATKAAEEIMVTSDGLRSRLVSSGWVTDATVLALGVDTDSYRPTGDDGRWRERLGAPMKGTLVGYAGDANEHDVLALYRALVAKAPGAHLALVTPGVTRAGLPASLRDEPGIHVLVRAGDRAPFFRSLDAFAFGGGQTDPRLLLEAMATGLPVVAARSPAVEDLTAGAEPCARLVPSGAPDRIGSALARLLEGNLRIQLGHAARHRALEIASVQAASGQVERVYSGVAPPSDRRLQYA